MGSGVRFKFQGSEVAFLSGYDASSPSAVITAITKANPAVATSTTPVTEGQVIYIQNVGGMTEVNNKAFIVNPINSTTFELVDTDSSGYGTYTSGGIFDIGTFSNFCELTGYNRTGGSSPEIPATTVCSTEAEYEVGLPDRGTTSLDYNFAPKTAIQQAIQDFDSSKQMTAVKVTLPNNGGEMVQLGFIQQQSEQAAVGTLWTANVVLRNTGPRYDIGF
jgi:hypothetical protein